MKFQSRRTGCTEMPSTSVVSSMLNPTKNRSSTACALRESCVASVSEIGFVGAMKGLKIVAAAAFSNPE
jgi:hypothetical protein